MSTSQKEKEESKTKAVVCFSGGQDSTTCLLWAKDKFNEVKAITFDYGQLHKRELDSAMRIASMLDVELIMLKIPVLQGLRSGLTQPWLHNVDEPHPDFPNLPGSFVPLRNLILLSSAAAFAIKHDIKNLITGVCQTDYSGYPDCREEFIHNLEDTIDSAIDARKKRDFFKIHTPLMKLTKAETVMLAFNLGGYDFMAYTHTCYKGQYPPCEECAACKLRAKGFMEAHMKDPIFARAQMDPTSAAINYKEKKNA